jgi:hypothetical protein
MELTSFGGYLQRQPLEKIVKRRQSPFEDREAGV